MQNVVEVFKQLWRDWKAVEISIRVLDLCKESVVFGRVTDAWRDVEITSPMIAAAKGFSISNMHQIIQFMQLTGTQKFKVPWDNTKTKFIVP